MQAAHAVRRQRNRVIFWCCAGGGLTILVVVGILVLKSRGVIPSSRNFSVAAQANDGGQFIWFAVTNEADSPLTIYDATVNGEYKLRPGTSHGSLAIVDARQSYPLKVTIGETALLVQRSFLASGPDGRRGSFKESYTKAAVYVDFKTNRGTFRYRPDRGWD
jgi:hypothetical protein